MEKQLIGRGVIAGALAGILAFLFARIVAEPQIQKAIDYGSGRDAAQALLDKAAGLGAAPQSPELFSRTVQGNLGIGVGMIAFGAAMGGLFAVTYAICLGRVGNLAPRSLALLVAAAGFLGFYLVPFLKYPADPPSIGHAETIRQRGGFYLVMVLAAIIGLALAVALGQRLQRRVGNWNASLIAAASYVTFIGVLMTVLPQFGRLHANLANYGSHATETPLPLVDATGMIVYPGFPADVLFNFRLDSVLAQLILWATIGLIFAPMADRLLRPDGHQPADRSREIELA